MPKRARLHHSNSFTPAHRAPNRLEPGERSSRAMPKRLLVPGDSDRVRRSEWSFEHRRRRPSRLARASSGSPNGYWSGRRGRSPWDCARAAPWPASLPAPCRSRRRRTSPPGASCRDRGLRLCALTVCRPRPCHVEMLVVLAPVFETSAPDEWGEQPGAGLRGRSAVIWRQPLILSNCGPKLASPARYSEPPSPRPPSPAPPPRPDALRCSQGACSNASCPPKRDLPAP